MGLHTAIQSKSGAGEAAERPVGDVPNSRAGTRPLGALADANTGLVAENEALEKRLAALESENDRLREGDRVIALPIRRTRPWAMADRDSLGLKDSRFVALLEEIRATGGNAVPVLVRRCEPFTDEAQLDHYEVICGRRRHECVRVLDTEGFSATLRGEVRDLDDTQAWLLMTRENLHREDLSPIERGRSWLAVVEQGMTTGRAISEMVGISEGSVSRHMSLAELEAKKPTVFSAFVDPRDVRLTWYLPLKRAIEQNEESVERVAREIQQQEPRPNAATVFRLLCQASREADSGAPAQGDGGESAGQPTVIERNGEELARRHVASEGAAVYTLPPALTQRISLIPNGLALLDSMVADGIAILLADPSLKIRTGKA
jgi:ParB/RepB/Spo0J family partition protein